MISTHKQVATNSSLKVLVLLFNSHNVWLLLGSQILVDCSQQLVGQYLLLISVTRYFQYLAFQSNAYLPKTIKYYISRFTFCQILNSYSRNGQKLIKILHKWRNFAKSGQTALNQYLWQHLNLLIFLPRWICSGSSDTKVKIWDSETGTLQGTLERHDLPVMDLVTTITPMMT